MNSYTLGTLSAALALLSAAPAWAQAEHDHAMHDHAMHDHAMHGHPHSESSAPEPPASAPEQAPAPELQLSPSRKGSGTAWQPDATPMRGHHFMAGDFMFMLHYNLFVGYDWQGSLRGDRQFTSMNWVMLGVEHPLGGGTLALDLMLSAEPFTAGGPRGYPLLLQSGETADGLPLHDRQHPHDLFMELALRYQRPLGPHFGFQVYVAAAGEPALGPVAFPHRLTAASDPLAPIVHHWQDSSHITFGVATLGLYTQHVKLEGSWFNGREPDENRYDFDFRAPDSYSARLSYNPNESWSFQVSGGYLKSPESLEPESALRRLTASATYAQRTGENQNFGALLSWGMNAHEGDHEPITHGALLEASLQFGWNTVFGRAEFVQKQAHDLVLPEMPDTEDGHHQVFPIGSLALGYVREFGSFGGVVPGIGIRGAVGFLGPALQPFYGTSLPVGGMLFLQLRPAESAVSDGGHDPSHGHHHGPVL